MVPTKECDFVIKIIYLIKSKVIAYKNKYYVFNHQKLNTINYFIWNLEFFIRLKKLRYKYETNRMGHFTIGST